MKKSDVDYSLYLVTNRDFMKAPTLEAAVEEALKGGCTLVQLREKNISSIDFFHLAERIKAITDAYQVPLIINDRVDIALAVDAAGVHIGQSDLPATAVRKIVGSEKIMGVSASNLPEALTAVKNGADYLGIGAMFSTSTKTDAQLTSMTELVKIRRQCSLPLVVIGGINKETIPLFHGISIDGLAVVSAILNQDNIAAAALEIKQMFHTKIR